MRRLLARSVNEDKQARSVWRSLGILLGGGAGLLLICGGALFWVLRGAVEMCANEPITTDVSPNGALKAVLFRRDCGATTSNSTHVSIIPASRQLPNEPGNVFVRSGQPSVAVCWIGDRHLSISGDGAGTAFVHLTDYRGIRITYD